MFRIIHGIKDHYIVVDCAESFEAWQNADSSYYSFEFISRQAATNKYGIKAVKTAISRMRYYRKSKILWARTHMSVNIEE